LTATTLTVAASNQFLQQPLLSDAAATAIALILRSK